MEHYIVTEFNYDTHSKLLPFLAGLHSGCITLDKAITTFKGPLSTEALLQWWRDRANETTSGQRVIYLLLDKRLSGGPQLIGSAMLYTDPSIDRHRAVIENVFVWKQFRRMGAAKMIIAKMQKSAAEKKRKLFTLQVETGSVAEIFFRKLGFIEAGKIPEYSPNKDGELKDSTIFYKQLATTG